MEKNKEILIFKFNVLISYFAVEATLAPNQTKDKKTWKGKVAKQWKKMHHSNQPGSQQNFPEGGGSIGKKVYQSVSLIEKKK